MNHRKGDQPFRCLGCVEWLEDGVDRREDRQLYSFFFFILGGVNRKSCIRSFGSVRDLASATVGSGDWCSLFALGVISPDFTMFVESFLPSRRHCVFSGGAVACCWVSTSYYRFHQYVSYVLWRVSGVFFFLFYFFPKLRVLQLVF